MGRAHWTDLNCKMAEYTKAVVDGRPCFHISLVIDVSPNCDCRPENDMAIGAQAWACSPPSDPVALDMACVDAVNAQTPLRGSAADDAHAKAHVHDHFQRIHPDTNWRSCLEHGEKIGIGTREYELIKIWQKPAPSEGALCIYSASSADVSSEASSSSGSSMWANHSR
ncbi:MAG: DUF362 domain-containing protein [Dysosmobacter sp.]